MAQLESYICTHPVDNLVIDGKLNEVSWEEAEWRQEFVDIEGDIKPKPLHKTQVKMLWDDEYYYIGSAEKLSERVAKIQPAEQYYS